MSLIIRNICWKILDFARHIVNCIFNTDHWWSLQWMCCIHSVGLLRNFRKISWSIRYGVPCVRKRSIVHFDKATRRRYSLWIFGFSIIMRCRPVCIRWQDLTILPTIFSRRGTRWPSLQQVPFICQIRTWSQMADRWEQNGWMVSAMYFWKPEIMKEMVWDESWISLIIPFVCLPRPVSSTSRMWSWQHRCTHWLAWLASFWQRNIIVHACWRSRICGRWRW